MPGVLCGQNLGSSDLHVRDFIHAVTSQPQGTIFLKMYLITSLKIIDIPHIILENYFKNYLQSNVNGVLYFNCPVFNLSTGLVV